MRHLIIISSFFIAGNCFARNNQQIKIKDTLAYNILTTVDKVLRIAEDPKRRAMALAGEPLKMETSGAMLYQSTVTMPGSVSTTVRQIATYRSDPATTRWQWEARLLDLPKGQQPALITQLQKKVDSILLSFKNRKRPAPPEGEYSISTSAWTSNYFEQTDAVLLIVQLTKKAHNTVREATDSIFSLYQPLLASYSTGRTCAPLFLKAMQIEGLSTEEIKTAFYKMLKLTASASMETAFDMLLNPPAFTDQEVMLSQFTAVQRDQIKMMARKVVQDYANNNQPKKDPVIEKKKEIEKEKPPTDPCEREIWELLIKPGQYISGNNRIYYVRDYSCNTDLYTLAWLDPSRNKKLFFETITVDRIRSYQQTSSAPFIICRNCNGVGHFMEYEWRQVGTYSNTYARSNEQQMITCGVCSGAGHIKMR